MQKRQHPQYPSTDGRSRDRWSVRTARGTDDQRDRRDHPLFIFCLMAVLVRVIIAPPLFPILPRSPIRSCPSIARSASTGYPWFPRWPRVPTARRLLMLSTPQIAASIDVLSPDSTVHIDVDVAVAVRLRLGLRRPGSESPCIAGRQEY